MSMMNKKCPHCGKEFSLETELFDVSPESALFELILAQMAKAYRSEFNHGFPTEGSPDLEALEQLFMSLKDEHDKVSMDSVSQILALWKEYLLKKGKRASISDFIFQWIPSQEPGAKVIPFRPRFD